METQNHREIGADLWTSDATSAMLSADAQSKMPKPVDHFAPVMDALPRPMQAEKSSAGPGAAVELFGGQF